MPYSEAQKRATLKYKAKAYERMEITVKKGMKDIYRAQAEERNMSFNTYIIHLLEKDRVDADEQPH